MQKVHARGLQYQDAIMQVCTFPQGSMWICALLSIKTFPNTSRKLYWPLMLTCSKRKVLCIAKHVVREPVFRWSVFAITNIDNRDLQPCHCNRCRKARVRGGKRELEGLTCEYSGDQSSTGDVISVAYHNHFLWSILRPQNYSFCAWQSLCYLFHFVKAAYISIGFKMWTQRDVRHLSGTSL